MKIISRVAEKIGFTDTELSVVLFFVFLIATGSVYKVVFSRKSPPPSYSYSKQDSLFYAIMNDTAALTPSHDSLFASVDSIYDMKDIVKQKPGKHNVPANGIDINHASVTELDLLPGVGLKTAEKILAYRKQIGRFKKIEQLMEIKGIGEAKFEKMKAYIIIK